MARGTQRSKRSSRTHRCGWKRNGRKIGSIHARMLSGTRPRPIRHCTLDRFAYQMQSPYSSFSQSRECRGEHQRLSSNRCHPIVADRSAGRSRASTDCSVALSLPLAPQPNASAEGQSPRFARTKQLPPRFDRGAIDHLSRPIVAGRSAGRSLPPGHHFPSASATDDARPRHNPAAGGYLELGLNVGYPVNLTLRQTLQH